MMKLKQKLQNPFALVAEGFVVGAIIFFATAPRDEPAAQTARSAESGIFAQISGA